MVDYSENGVFTPYVWQTSDQVHCDLLEWEGVFWGGDMVQGDSRSVRKVLVLLTCCTSCDIVGDPGFHPFPDQSVLGLSESFISSRVSCSGVVVNQHHQVPFLCFGGCGYGYLPNKLRGRKDDRVLVVPLALVNV